MDEEAVGVLGQRGIEGGGQLLDMGDDRGEDGDERADDFPTGLGFGLADLAGRGAAQARMASLPWPGRRPPVVGVVHPTVTIPRTGGRVRTPGGTGARGRRAGGCTEAS